MPDDPPRLGMFLRQWEADVAEGKTVRALHERLDEHIEDDKKAGDGLRTEIQNLRESRAYDRGRRSGGEVGDPEPNGFATVERTGRFPVPPPGGVHVGTPPPFPVPAIQPPPYIAVNVDLERQHRKSSSIPPIVRKLVHSKALQLAVVGIVTALLGWLSRHIGLGAPPAPPPSASAVHAAEK